MALLRRPRALAADEKKRRTAASESTDAEDSDVELQLVGRQSPVQLSAAPRWGSLPGLLLERAFTTPDAPALLVWDPSKVLFDCRTYADLARAMLAAAAWLRERGVRARAVRFDVVVCELDARGRWRLRHLESAFDAGE